MSLTKRRRWPLICISKCVEYKIYAKDLLHLVHKHCLQLHQTTLMWLVVYWQLNNMLVLQLHLGNGKRTSCYWTIDIVSSNARSIRLFGGRIFAGEGLITPTLSGDDRTFWISVYYSVTKHIQFRRCWDTNYNVNKLGRQPIRQVSKGGLWLWKGWLALFPPA